jgi:hypothetical protein
MEEEQEEEEQRFRVWLTFLVMLSGKPLKTGAPGISPNIYGYYNQIERIL